MSVTCSRGRDQSGFVARHVTRRVAQPLATGPRRPVPPGEDLRAAFMKIDTSEPLAGASRSPAWVAGAPRVSGRRGASRRAWRSLRSLLASPEKAPNVPLP